MSTIQLYSEVGELEGVILHPPGPEVENMTPENAERALYSDILNLSVARKEYTQLDKLLHKLAPAFEVEDLLRDVLRSEEIKEKVVKRACYEEGHPSLIDNLMLLSEKELARVLIQGVPLERSTLTAFLSQEHFSLRPLHNFFFTRDASMAFHDRVLIARMANRVRDRESLMMQAIFSYHPRFRVKTTGFEASGSTETALSLEGGDLLVASENITLIGLGSRTNSRGIDQLVKMIAGLKEKHHLLVQELPSSPESFIHLDMVFTLLDHDSCMVFEPLILKSNKYQTIQIDIDNGKVTSIRYTKNLLKSLSLLGMDLKPSFCGGKNEMMIQEREQWHSGANFFAVAPGQLIGYNRNVHTLEDLSGAGYEIIRARDVLEDKTDLTAYGRYVVTVDGSELSRGGGGIRCMTMPFRRKR